MLKKLTHLLPNKHKPTPLVESSSEQVHKQSSWQTYCERLKDANLPIPNAKTNKEQDATITDEDALYQSGPSFIDLLPYAEFQADSKTLLLDDGQSVAAFYELMPIGTEGREANWLQKVRDALENALQDSFDEEEKNPWVIQFYTQDEISWDRYLDNLNHYRQPRTHGSEFSEAYLSLFEKHLYAVAKPGGLFTDNTVTKLPWRGQNRRIRLVIYRRVQGATSRRDNSPEQALNTVCDRLVGGLSNAGIRVKRLAAHEVHDWLLRWFNPYPDMLGNEAKDRDYFYKLVGYPPEVDEGELELASGVDFSERLFFNKPRSDVDKGLWYFDNCPHRVLVLDKLRSPPSVGHITGETKKGGDAINALFDQMPEDTLLCITMVITPQDILESHLN